MINFTMTAGSSARWLRRERRFFFGKRSRLTVAEGGRRESKLGRERKKISERGLAPSIPALCDPLILMSFCSLSKRVGQSVEEPFFMEVHI